MQPFNLPVEEFTTPDPILVESSTALDELEMLVKNSGVRHLPVVSDGKVTGIISDRDLRFYAGLSDAEKYQVTAEDIMSPNPVTVVVGTPLDEAAFLMSQKKVGSVLVLEESGQLYGIFTATDALNALIELVRNQGK